MEANLQVNMGEMHLAILSGGCHGLRRPERRFKCRMIIGTRGILGWDHVNQYDLLW
jgi:hypothetical protein